MEIVTIRAYTPADKDACMAVFDSNRPMYFSAGERMQFGAFLDALPGPYLVLEEADHVLACGGYAVVEESATAFFCWGMVEHARHRQGLGKRLSLARLDGIRADPRVRRVRLDTSHLTAGFYEGLGFTVTEMIRDGYWRGLHRCEMEWIIDCAAGEQRATGETS
jgi:ribosomal protein S18 acetylase RimI-like enzyme